jgi:hypothetical protein
MSRPKVKFIEIMPITPNELSYKFYQMLKNYQLKNKNYITQFVANPNFDGIILHLVSLLHPSDKFCYL